MITLVITSELTADAVWNPENLLAGRTENHCYLGSQDHWCLWNLSIVMKEFRTIVTRGIWDRCKPGGIKTIVPWQKSKHNFHNYLQIGEDHHLKDPKHCSQEDQDQLTWGIWKYCNPGDQGHCYFSDLRTMTLGAWASWHLGESEKTVTWGFWEYYNLGESRPLTPR